MRQKYKIFTRGLLCLTMVLITVFGSVTTAFAAGNLTFLDNEAGQDEDTSAFITSGGKKIFDWNKLSNKSKVENHWVETQGNFASNLVDMGVLYGVKDEDKYTLPLSDTITGKDALGLAMFYYWPINSSGYITARGSSGSGLTARNNSYVHAGTLFDSNSGMSGNYGNSIAGASSFSRQYAFYIIANCIMKRSGNTIKLDMYSDTQLGYYANNEDRIDNVKISGSSFYINEEKINDYSDAEDDLDKDYKRSANMLIELGVLEGRKTSQGIVTLDVTGSIEYAEFYKLLVIIDHDYSDYTPKYSDIDANLAVSGGEKDINYKDLLNGQSVYMDGILNASRTESRQSIESYDFSVSDSYDNNNSISSSREVANFPFEYNNNDIGYYKTCINGGDKTYTFPFSGSLTVTDNLGTTESASDNSYNTVNVFNVAPEANFTATTNSLNSAYNKFFYYATEPITLTDNCSDYENAMETWTYTIKKDGVTVASSTNFDNIINKSDIVSAFSGNTSTKTHNITFAQPGAYTITVTCVDELGKKDTYNKTITVREAPQPPTAIIKANDNTFSNYDTDFTDASTDPNDDIVTWTWGKTIMYFDEVMNENGEGTGEGKWVVAEAGKDYTGKLNDSVRNSNGSYTTAAGTLQFKNYGKYRISLTVTDATGLTDTTYHDINVLEDIPIIIVDPEPDQPDIYYTVTFVNTNNVVSSTQVKAGTKTPADKVPAIVDIDGYTEHGWTLDGNKVVEPTSIVVNGNLTFCVLTTPEDENPNLHTVTFINTDGTRSSVKVPHGGTVPQSEVPAIVDDPSLQEYGWTRDGDIVVDPATVTIIKDTVFWVKTDEITDTPNDPDDYEPYYVDGTLYVKQNRSAIIDVKNSLSPPSDPIQVSKTEWVTTAVDGYNLNDVKWEQTNFAGRLTNTFIAKEPGTFKVKITLHNNYSDTLAKSKPNSSKLEARTATITVVVYPDIAPQASLFVNNANPNFHTNPTWVNVTVASTALSTDYDKIGTYEWTIYRDMDNDGSYDDEEPIFHKTGKNLPSVTLPVRFQSGIVGKFKVYLKVTEEFGQATLSQYITNNDMRYTETEKEFEVNWTPCISFDLKYQGNEWAYVDDTIPISAIVKDENTSTCTTKWRLRKQTDTGFEYVDTSQFDTWNFKTLGGKLCIPDDGYYSLEAKVTDDHGYSETFVSNTIRIYNLPTAIISDNKDYRWNNTKWQYKQSRRFDLNGNTSYPDDNTGKALHQIDHNRDTWSITPLNGGTVDDICVLSDNGITRMESTEQTYFCASWNEFNEKIAIIKPGTYRVDYQVTNTYGKKSPVVSQVITIVKDEEPEIDTGTPSSYELLGSKANNQNVTIGLTNVNVTSTDQDIVGTEKNFEAFYRYDSDNDGDYKDEAWKPCTADFSTSGNNTSKVKLSVTAKVNQVGMYQIKLVINEGFGQETLDSIIPPECYISKEFYHEVQVDNTRPQGTFDVSNNVYGDVVFLMGNSDDNDEISEKTLNYKNSFGSIEGASVFQLDVNSIKNLFDCKFALHTTWNTSSDMDTHIYLYNANGNEINHIWYGNKNGDGVSLNVDDTKGNNSDSQNNTEPNSGGGEWFTIDFPNLSNDVAYMKISINAFSKSATTTVSLVNTTEKKIVIQQTKYVSNANNVNEMVYFGKLSRSDNNIWNFYDANNQYFSGAASDTLANCMTNVSFNCDHNVFIIWSEDTIPKELDKSSPTYKEDYAELLSLLVSQNVHLIVLGSNKNQEVMQSLLDQCLVPGIFIHTGSVNKDLDASREFIASVLRKGSDANVKYVLVGENTEYNKYYTDFNGHPHWLADGNADSILSSKWWYSQDENYFLNPLGTIAENKEWLTDEITTFTKIGKYYVNYKVKDNSVPDSWLSDNSTENPFNMYRYWSNNYGNDEYDETGKLSNPYAEIYVHRRPIAEFNFTPSLTWTDELKGIKVANAAYDLDHYEAGNSASEANKGLQMYEWTWQLTNNLETKNSAVFLDANEGEKWINEQLANINYDSNTGVLISYRVRDIDGVETKENVSNTHKISGNIYLAPASYHHTTLDTDLVINGVTVAKAGTYVTTSYVEAISELRAAADAKKAIYNNRVTIYNTLEATAVAAEQTRDAKQQEVTNMKNKLNSLKEQLTSAKNTLAQYKSNLSTANSTKSAAKTAYNTAKDELTDLQSELNTLNNKLTTLKAQLSTLENSLSSLQTELSALKCKDTSKMTKEELAAHQSNIEAKQLAVTNKQAEVNAKKSEVTTKQTEVTAKQSEVNSKTVEMNNLYTSYQTAVTNVNNWQTKVTQQQTQVNNLSTGISDTETTLTGLCSELSTLTSQASSARTSANKAKSNMNTVKSEWDTAEAAVTAVKPIKANATAWATTTKEISIPDGVWSHYNTVRVTGNPIPPIAKFTPNNIYYDLHENVLITDQSYSPNGNNINVWKWTITNKYNNVNTTVRYSLSGAAGTTKVSSVNQMESLISQYVTKLMNSQKLGMTNEENTYKITLVVTDDKSVPLTSNPYSVSIILKPSNNPPTADPTDKSIYSKDGVLVYEYDPYDANVKNAYYKYNGTSQLRGTETIDWSLIVDDPDNHDTYGTANDSDKYIINYVMELFKDHSIKTVTDDRTTSNKLTYGDYTVTKSQALINAKLAPFTSAKNGNLSWGAYRITTTVTDVPNNGMESKSVTIKTSNTTSPKHLYVIPALDIGNVQYTWSETGNKKNPQDLIPAGDTITVTCTTNAETVGVHVKMPNGSGKNTITNATLISTDEDGTKHWSANVVIPNDLEEDDLKSGNGYTFTVEGWTDYGRDTGEKTRTKAVTKSMNVLTLKLYNFNITNIADPSVGFDGNAVYVPNLAYDKSNSPNSVLAKKGYAFYFEISSKGMRNNDDSISITPSFYGYDSGLYNQQLDVYYKLRDGSYVPTSYAGRKAFSITTTDGINLGTAGHITLNANSRISNGLTQKWAGIYGLPSTAIFVKHGGDPDSINDRWTDPLNKGVLIAFDIDAVKNGENKYNYIGRGQWNKERTASSGAYVNTSKAIYQDGAVIVIDSKHSAAGDYESRPVWRRS